MFTEPSKHRQAVQDAAGCQSALSTRSATVETFCGYVKRHRRQAKLRNTLSRRDRNSADARRITQRRRAIETF